MKKVLIIGNSASTLAAAKAYFRGGAEIYTQGEVINPGLNEISAAYNVGGLCDFESLKNFSTKIQPDLVFVGPCDPLALGVVDFFNDSLNIPVVGPRQACTILESSKAFTRKLVSKYELPGQIRFKVFTSKEGIPAFVEELNGEFVVKADGLKGGLGVKVSGDHFTTTEEGLQFAYECIDEAGLVVIEEKLIGQEFSLMSLCDGETALNLPAVKDYKRALERDKGANTGGMGAIIDRGASLPFLDEQTLKEASEINRLTLKAIKDELKIPFKGVLFGGFMITQNGLRLLEYNVRTGDPEAIAALSVLKTNFLDLSMALVEGHLHEIQLELEEQAAVCKYIVAIGYPEATHDGAILKIPELPPTVEAYTAWVEKSPEGLRMMQGGSVGRRAVALLGKGASLQEAEAHVEEVCQKIEGPFYHRSDIGKGF